MPYLQVYFDNALKDEAEIKDNITGLGRDPDNAVRIENAGVSGHHARIIRQGQEYFIEDAGSTNGTLLNGKPLTERRPLDYGDRITIFRHTLKFSAVVSQTQTASSVSQDTHAVAQDGTVAVDVSQVGALMAQRLARAAHILVPGADGRPRKYPLGKLQFSLGKGPRCDLRTPGLFAPKQAARILRKSDGYHLVPGKRAKARINGVSARDSVKLQHGDRVEIRNLSFEFRAPDSQPE